MAEYFSGVVQPEYRQVLHSKHHREMIASRQILTYEEYETIINFNMQKMAVNKIFLSITREIFV